jgi:hypothetical protein
VRLHWAFQDEWSLCEYSVFYCYLACLSPRVGVTKQGQGNSVGLG